jgi:hypothetical protein
MSEGVAAFGDWPSPGSPAPSCFSTSRNPDGLAVIAANHRTRWHRQRDRTGMVSFAPRRIGRRPVSRNDCLRYFVTVT